VGKVGPLFLKERLTSLIVEAIIFGLFFPGTFFPIREFNFLGNGFGWEIYLFYFKVGKNLGKVPSILPKTNQANFKHSPKGRFRKI